MWKNEGWANPIVEEEYGPDRTILTLPLVEKREVIANDGVTDELTDGEIEILSYISDNPHATYETMANVLGISRKTVAERIKGLKGKNKIQRVGSDARGYWKVNQ